ncbi:MAG: hypothetical protein JST40_09305 [Armatimonadetes bacterium]|nr:hypothetical protein [Armatimonadota bacterium]
MKKDIPIPVVIGAVAVALLIGVFFIWRSFSSSDGYTNHDQEMDAKITKPAGIDYYGSGGATGQPAQGAAPAQNPEAAARGGH